MHKITENDIELLAIEQLEKLGYHYIHGAEIAPDASTSSPYIDKRESFEEVLLVDRLREAINRINPNIPTDAKEDALKQIQRLNSPELIANNEAFHRMLIEGIKVTYQDNGDSRGDLVWLMDFDNIENNEFLIVNQFTVIENNVNKRPDVILFVNGLPLIVIELKNPAVENATINSAYKQLETYKAAIPNLFTYNGFLIISDGLEAKAGSLSAGLTRFMSWPVCVRARTGRNSSYNENRFYVYVIKCDNDSMYIGQTGDIEKRWNEHLTGNGAKWTKSHKPIQIIHHEIYSTREEVIDREKWLKTGFGRKWIKREIAAKRNKVFAFEDVPERASHLESQMEILINGMLNKGTLLDLIRHFIVFEKTKREDPKTQITTIETTKKLAAYHQYYAVNKAVATTVSASSEAGDRKGGVVWHTQGSGKSLSMVFYTGKTVLVLDNPTIVVITDRNDLDDQLFDTFAASKQLLRQEPVQAEDRQHLKELLKVASGGVVFTTIHKFQPDEGNVYEQLSDRKNIVVIADEAHRTQYGFKAKTIDDKDKDGNIIGKKVVYGFAKYMRDALPNATYLGFTGTPIESSDVNTPAVFGNYVDIYDIAQAVEDGATVRIFYESRLAKIELSDEGKKLVEDLDDELALQDLSETQKVKAKWTQLEALIGSEDRIKQVAKDIVDHYETRQIANDGKAMIVAMSRRIAADLYKEIEALKPEWHNDDQTKGAIKVVMTSVSSDGPEIERHHTTKDQRRMLADRMRDPKDELKLVIVRDMWLTGFDVPCLNTLYIDKPMKGHNLMQAIARVNRVYKDKPAGLVVDYLGIASDLKKALSFYSDSGGKGDPAEAQEKAVQLMLEKLEVVSQMFLEKPVGGHSPEYENMVKDQTIPYLGKRGLLYEEYFTADTATKLKIILAAEEHILSLENGKKRFIDSVTALSSAFAIAIPHDQAMDVKEEIAFFQAVKSRLLKFDSTETGLTDESIESAIRQVIDQALVSDQVIDVFDAAGIKKPDISILSEEFLLEVKNMQHKNVALEVLKKLLNDEIKTRTKVNLIQSRSLMEMLEAAIQKYQNKVLTAAEVIEELIKLSKEIQKMDKEPEEMGLTTFEYAFYTAIANNKSAKDVMEQDKLRELAVVLFERVKKNASIDWTIKESVKAKLKVIVKRTLRQYGYPPDMQMLATETVLKQAELIANEITSEV